MAYSISAFPSRSLNWARDFMASLDNKPQEGRIFKMKGIKKTELKRKSSFYFVAAYENR